MNRSNYHHFRFSPESPDIPGDIYYWFRTPYLLYCTGSVFGLNFCEQKIDFGCVTEKETRETWRNTASDRNRHCTDLRRSTNNKESNVETSGCEIVQKVTNSSELIWVSLRTQTKKRSRSDTIMQKRMYCLSQPSTDQLSTLR